MDAATRRLILTKSLADCTGASLNDFAYLAANEAARQAPRRQSADGAW